MFTSVCQSFVGRTRIVWLGILLAVFLGSSAFGQDPPSNLSGQVLPPPAIAQTDSTRAPLVLTLQDALARAKANNPQYRSALTDLGVAHQDTVQSRAQLLPNVNYNMQYIYTQGNGTPTGRFRRLETRPDRRDGPRSSGFAPGAAFSQGSVPVPFLHCP